MKTGIRFFLFTFFLSILLAGCTSDQPPPSVDHIELPTTFKRFDQPLFEMDTLDREASIEKLRSEFPGFLDFFCNQLMAFGPSSEDSGVRNEIISFISEPAIREVYEKCQLHFPNLQKQEKALERAFQYFKYYFPEKAAPIDIIFLVAAFQPAAFTTGSGQLGISLDMYLGANYPAYQHLEYPEFLYRRFEPEYMPANALSVWLKDLFAEPTKGFRFIDQMVHQGKLLYAIDKMLPYSSEKVKTGFTSEQLVWCSENEQNIWAYFIDRKLLYEVDPSKYQRYLSEGPFTPGMPNESPGKIAGWLGLQIVKAYMAKKPETSFTELFAEEDGQQILLTSRYKPQQ